LEVCVKLADALIVTQGVALSFKKGGDPWPGLFSLHHM